LPILSSHHSFIANWDHARLLHVQSASAAPPMTIVVPVRSTVQQARVSEESEEPAQRESAALFTDFVALVLDTAPKPPPAARPQVRHRPGHQRARLNGTNAEERVGVGRRAA